MKDIWDKDGNRQIEMKCATVHTEKFGSIECSTEKHDSHLKEITLADGTIVNQLSCTDYADGHTEVITKPCIGALPNLDVPQFHFSGND